MPKSKTAVVKKELNKSQRDKLILLKKKKQQLKNLIEKRARLDRDHKGILAKLKRHEELNKIMFFGHPDKGYLGKYGKWAPNPLQKKVFDAIEKPAKRIVLMSGGNQIGKTLAETCICMAMMRGYWPWEDPKEVGLHIWEARNWKPPISIRWIGGAWEGHIQKVIIEKGLGELWPSQWKTYTKKNNLGVVHIWKDTDTGNEVQIMSSNQNVKEFEGWTGHCVLFDEPAPREIWVACQRGLIANKGIAMMGATLLSEGWITSDIINKVDDKGQVDRSVSYFSADIYTNLGFGLDEEGIEAFKSQLSDAEREARIDGVSTFMSSLCLKIDKDKNIIDRFVIPTHWMIDVAIDIGIAKPHDITYVATDEKGMKYLVFEDEVRGNGDAIRESIIVKENRYNLRINRVICDPLAKADKNNENSVWERIDTVLNRHGHYLELGSKDKEDGIIAINNHLLTINGMPALFFFADCLKAIKQCLNWVREADTQKPQKKDDDQPENLYRLMLLDTVWTEMEDENYVETELDRSGADPITGY